MFQFAWSPSGHMFLMWSLALAHLLMHRVIHVWAYLCFNSAASLSSSLITTYDSSNRALKLSGFAVAMTNGGRVDESCNDYDSGIIDGSGNNLRRFTGVL